MLRIKYGMLKKLINEALICLQEDWDDDHPSSRGIKYADVDKRWHKELAKAPEFVQKNLHTKNLDAAKEYVRQNWSFDELDYYDEADESKKKKLTALLAFDHKTHKAFAHLDKMGGWYYRLGDKGDFSDIVFASERVVPNERSSDYDHRAARPTDKTNPGSRSTSVSEPGSRRKALTGKVGPTGTKVSRYK